MARTSKCTSLTRWVYVFVFLGALLLVNRLLFSSRKLGHFYHQLVVERSAFRSDRGKDRDRYNWGAREGEQPFHLGTGLKMLSSKYRSWSSHAGDGFNLSFSPILAHLSLFTESDSSVSESTDTATETSLTSAAIAPSRIYQWTAAPQDKVVTERDRGLPVDQSLMPPPLAIAMLWRDQNGTNVGLHPTIATPPKLDKPVVALVPIGPSSKTQNNRNNNDRKKRQSSWIPDLFSNESESGSDLAGSIGSVSDLSNSNDNSNRNKHYNGIDVDSTSKSSKSSRSSSNGSGNSFINILKYSSKNDFKISESKSSILALDSTKNGVILDPAVAEKRTSSSSPLVDGWAIAPAPFTSTRSNSDNTKAAAAAAAVETAKAKAPLDMVSDGGDYNNDNNPFIEEVYKIFNNVDQFNNIVGFNGHQVKAMFSPKSLEYGVELSSRADYSAYNVTSGVHRWGVVESLIRASHRYVNSVSSSSYTGRPIAAVPLFNEHKIGDFFELITNEYRFKGRPRQKNGGILDKTEILRIFENDPTKFVWINSVDENWGFFSTPIGTRTTKWINMTNHLLIHHANHETVKTLIHSPKVALIVCNSHVDPLIGAHEKIIPLPLGVNGNHKKDLIRMIIQFVKENKIKKDKLLYINNSGWGDREKINALVASAFSNTQWHPLVNSYRSGKSFDDLAREIASSKFVLCPSGLGFDTYRLWETLLLGSIPIVESNAGFDRAYSMLPVLVLRNFTDLTPGLLESAYPCFYRNAKRFGYSHLTRKHWFQLIGNASRIGSATFTLDHHPFKNPICSIL